MPGMYGCFASTRSSYDVTRVQNDAAVQLIPSYHGFSVETGCWAHTPDRVRVRESPRACLDATSQGYSLLTLAFNCLSEIAATGTEHIYLHLFLSLSLLSHFSPSPGHSCLALLFFAFFTLPRKTLFPRISRCAWEE